MSGVTGEPDYNSQYESDVLLSVLYVVFHDLLKSGT